MLSRSHRATDEWLIDVAEGNVSLREVIDGLGIIPAIVPHLYNPGVFDELPRQLLYVLAVQRSVLERNRKLDKQSAEFPFAG